MYAITRTGTAEEPLVDSSRVEGSEIPYQQTRNSLSGDLEQIFPPAQWTRAIYDERKNRLPQTISHRGYKAVYPENTMCAFRGAVDAGTHAIETDIHLTKDGRVVLSHDRDLKRCFGRLEKIIECDWQFIGQQRTLKEPHEPMPQLKDLLEYLAQPEQEHIWLLLDIKVDNDANDVMRLIAETIESTCPGSQPWNSRIVLGIWAARYLPLCAQYLPGYSISYIGFSTYLARQFLKIPNAGFNMLQKVLIGPIGTAFIKDVKKAQQPLYLWTVNEVNLMRWSIQHEVDGVITDNPKLFRELCDSWDELREPIAEPSWSQWFNTFFLYCLLTIFWLPLRRRFPESVDTFLKGRKVKPGSDSRI